MDYKQKYEQAIFRMNKWVEGSEITDPKEVAEFVFPELKESEDERIRKELINFFSNGAKYDSSTNGIKDKNIIAWLEKQGEQKTILPKWKYKKDNAPLLRDSIILNKYGCVAKSPSGALVSDVWVMDYDELKKLPKEEFEKQGEQKPAWSEEDEKHYQGCLNLMKLSLDTKPYPYYNDYLWLKSLKQRMKGE